MLSVSDLGNILTHIFMISTYFSDYFESINAIFWTVIVEVHFYIFYPIVWWLLRKYSISNIFIVSFLIGIAYFVVASKYTIPGMERIMHQQSSIALFWKWVLGAVLAELYWNKKPGFLIQLMSLSGVLVVSIILSFVPEIFVGQSLALQYERFVLPFLSFITVGSLLFSSVRQKENQQLKWVGKVSYSLYLWHPIALLLITEAFKKGGIIPFIIALLFSLFFAWVSYILIENPSISIGKQIIDRFSKNNKEESYKTIS
eukprot:TRINITY_DN8620_c0_g1_i2.p1 TRINITY_DN8620_c0_g1~~TRINITY_DN8620_c0_g1_i2.p1  ORF type:complete len:258 (+),score=-65.20 TRINITY_DN8620_c0_g1_i2:216-989(+)